MIDDWVYNAHNRKNEKVAEIGCGLVMLDYNDLYEYDEIEPIPLTSEILEKNGFELSVDFGNVYSLKESQRFWAVYVSEGVYALGCQSIDSSFANIRYVHQLQHALRICEIEKEIIL